MDIIDLRSDTITQPTDEMRDAMFHASVGDDVYGEDPTINALEQLSAQILNKEAALFTSSGTMSNLIAVLTHTHPGNEIILGSESHILWYEVGGASTLGGVVMRTVPNDRHGQLDLNVIEKTIREPNIHYPPTTLLCLENTHNRCGGAVLTAKYTSAVTELSHKHGLHVHLDGARIFNAAIALDIPAYELVKDVDSVCFCLSKGLSAPVGSILCGTRNFIDNARKWRKMLGGGMRQAGVIAAAGIVALKTMVERLKEDHGNARRLAQGLANIPGITVTNTEIQSNIVMFELAPAISVTGFMQQLNNHGIKVGSRGGGRFRAVTHRMVGVADIDVVLSQINVVMKSLPEKG